MSWTQLYLYLHSGQKTALGVEEVVSELSGQSVGVCPSPLQRSQEIA